jgi:hypothetical protein
MLIFIDESGDPGFSFKQGSSKVFILTLVIFNFEKDAEKTARRIDKFKTKYWDNRNREIKFHGLGKYERLKFLKEIKDCDFRIRVMIVEKRSLDSSKLKKSITTYYNFFLGKFLEHNKEIIENASIRLDGTGGREFKKTMNSYLRKTLKKKAIRDFKFIDSHKDVLIQLTDIVAGSIHRTYQSDKNDSKIYRDIIKDKIDEEWVFR